MPRRTRSASRNSSTNRIAVHGVGWKGIRQVVDRRHGLILEGGVEPKGAKRDGTGGYEKQGLKRIAAPPVLRGGDLEAGPGENGAQCVRSFALAFCGISTREVTAPKKPLSAPLLLQTLLFSHFLCILLFLLMPLFGQFCNHRIFIFPR